MAETITTQLRLIGQRAYISGARASAESIRDIGKASDETTPGMKLMAGAGATLRTGLRLLSVAGAATSATFVALAISAGKVGLEFRASIEDAETGMTTLLKDGKLAKKTVEDVMKFAKDAPKLNIAEAVSSVQLLVGAGLDAKKAVPTMRTFSDTLSAMGKRPEDLQRMTYAFMQMMSKGQISAEELRGQLGEIFPASKLLARGMGISMRELSEQMKKGSLKGQKYIDILITEMGKEFKGGTERAAGTFNGMINNIRENAKYTLGLVFEPLFFYLRDKVFPQVQKVTDEIAKWAQGGGPQRLINSVKGGYKNETFKPVAGKLGIPKNRKMGVADVADAMESKKKKRSWLEQMLFNVAKIAGKVLPVLKKFGKGFMDAIKPARPFLDNVLLPLIKGLGKGLVAGFFALLPLIKGFATALGWLGKKAKEYGLEKWFERIGFLIGYVFGPGKVGIFKPFGWALSLVGRYLAKLGPYLKIAGGWIGKFVGWIGKAVSWLWKASGANRRFIAMIVSLGVKVSAFIFKIGTKWYGFWFKLVWTVTKFAAKVLVAVGKFVGTMVGKFSKGVYNIVKYFWGIGTRIARGIASAVGAVVSAVTSFGQQIGRALADAIWGVLPEWAKKLLGAAGGVIGGVWNSITGGGDGGSPPSGGGGGIPRHPAATAGGTTARPAQPSTPSMNVPAHMRPVIPSLKVENNVSLQWRGREVAKSVADDTADKKARR